MNTFLTIIYVIICAALTFVVLGQEGNSQGLGAVNGVADTYWGKNKGRSIECLLERLTAIGAVLFIVLAFVLNIVK